jgi:hypothetical protein
MLDKPCAFPALLIKISICLKFSGSELIAVATSSLLETSNCSVVTSVSLLNSFSRFSKRSFLLPQSIYLILFFAKISAVAFPIPEVAPVINAVCFIYLFIMRFLSSQE